MVRGLESVGGAEPVRERQQHRVWDRKGASRDRFGGTEASTPEVVFSYRVLTVQPF
jgi:hypothetical protein